MDPVTLGMAKADAAKKYAGDSPSTVATRILGGRMGTIDASTAKTFQLSLEVADHFDAVRVIFASTDRTNSHGMLAVAASVAASAADLNNSAGAWVAGSRQGSTQIHSELSPSGADRITYTLSDWIPISSVARSDSGTKPLLVVRAYMSASAVLPCYGNGTDDFTNWATRTDGRLHAMRYQDGDHATTATGFTSTTNRSQSPIVGVQYLARGHVITVAGVGDSITEGQGTYLGEGFILPAIDALSDSETKFEYMNCGWSGQTMDRFAERAIDIMESEVCPDIIVFPAASPNDIPTTITAADITAFRTRRARITAAAKRNGVVPVVWTLLPTNTSVRPYGATDSLRVAYNAEVLAQASRKLIVVDTATALSGTVSGGQVQMTGQTDGIHPNNSGNATLTPIVRAGIKAAARRTASAAGRRDTRSGVPVFSTTETSLQLSKAGVWVFRSGSSGFWTLPPLTGGARQDSQIITVKVRETSGALQVSRVGTDAINYAGATGSSVTIRPGQTFTFIPAGNGTWDVLAPAAVDFSLPKRDGGAALTMDRTAAFYVFTGSSAAAWNLPSTRFTGQKYTVKNCGSATVTISRQGTDQIFTTSLVTSFTVTAGSSATIIYDGTNWVVL